MNIGLWDDDVEYYFPMIFNLELMKISSYYKKKREIVTYMPAFRPEMYSKVFVRKDYDDVRFNKKLLLPHVISGGYAFHPDIYIPMEEDIEMCKPDTYIYHRINTTTPFAARVKRTQLNTMHIRLSLDEKTIWNKLERAIDYNSSPTSFCFHDRALGTIDGALDTIKYIFNEFDLKNRCIGMKYPAQLYDFDDVAAWLTLPKAITYQINYNGNLTWDNIQDYIDNPNHIKLTQMGKLGWNPTYGWSSEDDFFENGLPDFFAKSMILQRYNIPILPIYEDNFFSSPLMKELYNIFSIYFFRHKDKYAEDLYKYIHYKIKNHQFQESYVAKIRECFQYIRIKSYETFKQFYQPIKEVPHGQI